jgi:hypothetical protein
MLRTQHSNQSNSFDINVKVASMTDKIHLNSWHKERNVRAVKAIKAQQPRSLAESIAQAEWLKRTSSRNQPVKRP